ncbi:MAG: CoA-binding protein, partial [Dehalococcoidia bacterium]|nr:CoA-binding protein [Dehalococcoidia bacterium]
WTRTFLDGLLGFGFDRPLYLVNPRGGEIRGIKVYADIDDVPSPVEYVVSTVPARAAVDLVRKCARKGTRVIHFCTAGFGETGIPELAELEQQLLAAARETGIRLLGPNCMGVYCPDSRFSFDPIFPREAGPVGYLSQSGGNVSQLVAPSMHRGIRFSKVFSYGNALDINECDLLEYLAEDPATEIIAMYVEGVKDGPRFRRALERATARKPVVALKGGVTAGGARAASGHTGSLAGIETTWESLCKQTGAMNVATLDEMADALVALRFMRLPAGNRTLVVGGGGGASVILTDQFEKNGLSVPRLPADVVERIREFSSDAGNILSNPVDYSQNMFDPEQPGTQSKMDRMVEIASAHSGIDLMVIFMSFTAPPSLIREKMANVGGLMIQAVQDSKKPSAAIIEPSVLPEIQSFVFPLVQQMVAANVPVFYSAVSAARAINALLAHERMKRSRGIA